MTPPPPDRPDVAALFDRVADTYDSVDVPWFGPIAEGLVEAAAPRPGERALDIGCGRGAATRPLAEAVGPSGRVVAFDLAPRMVELTARDLRDLPQVEVRRDDARAPALEPGAWDVVVASLVLFFLPDPGAVVQRWAALLAPGGRLAVSTFGRQDERWQALDEVFTPYLPPALLDARTSGRRGPFATDEGVEALLRDAGLAGVRTSGRTVTARFRDVGHWYQWSQSHGQRAMWDALPEADRPAVLERAGELLGDDPGFSQQVRYTVGHRA